MEKEINQKQENNLNKKTRKIFIKENLKKFFKPDKEKFIVFVVCFLIVVLFPTEKKYCNNIYNNSECYYLWQKTSDCLIIDKKCEVYNFLTYILFEYKNDFIDINIIFIYLYIYIFIYLYILIKKEYLKYF